MVSVILEKNIYKLVVAFRIALQEAALSDASLGGTFPQGWCGTACDMLSKYLAQNGISTAYVFGENSNCITHAWLEYEKYRYQEELSHFPQKPAF